MLVMFFKRKRLPVLCLCIFPFHYVACNGTCDENEDLVLIMERIRKFIPHSVGQRFACLSPSYQITSTAFGRQATAGRRELDSMCKYRVA